MTRRPGTSLMLVLGAVVLLIAIAVGNSMGNRVLGQIADRAGVTTPIPLASTAPPDTSASQALWKRRQVLSVATDPAFPDPRITPEPEIPVTPRPRPATPRPTRQPTLAPATPAPPDEAPIAPSASAGLPSPQPSGSRGPDETASAEPSASRDVRPTGVNRASGPQPSPTP